MAAYWPLLNYLIITLLWENQELSIYFSGGIGRRSLKPQGVEFQIVRQIYSSFGRFQTPTSCEWFQNGNLAQGLVPEQKTRVQDSVYFSWGLTAPSQEPNPHQVSWPQAQWWIRLYRWGSSPAEPFKRLPDLKDVVHTLSWDLESRETRGFPDMPIYSQESLRVWGESSHLQVLSMQV